MSRETATRSETTDESLESGRLSRADRRDALLDAAVELVVSGDADAVSMEAVAERAGVSRPLVYKHFANRGELLAAVYQREATLLHRELAAEVGAAATVEGMFRTLIRGALQAAAERGHVFSALRSAGGRSHELRREQRGRDVETVRAFARRAMRELGLDRRRATATTATLLAAIDPVLTQWRLRPTADQAQLLEEIYVGMVRGALRDATA
jgi:AcrR family transcriptional regulator